jgi:hypothetical protein
MNGWKKILALTVDNHGVEEGYSLRKNLIDQRRFA